LGGDSRYAGSGAKIGFHQYALPGLTAEEQAEITRAGKADLAALGVPSDFVDRVFATPADQMWYPSKDELLNAKIVTKFVDPYNFSAAAFGRKITDNDADTLMSSVASLAALKQVDKATYDQLIRNMVAEYDKGDSVADIVNGANAIVVSLALRSRLTAYDDTLTAVATFMGQLAVQLIDKNPQMCMKVLLGTSAAMDYTQYLSEQLREEDVELTAKIILSDKHQEPRTTIGKDEAEKMIRAIWVDIIASGVDISAVGKNVRTAEEDVAACRAFGVFFSKLSAYNSSKRGALIRYLLAGGNN